LAQACSVQSSSPPRNLASPVARPLVHKTMSQGLTNHMMSDLDATSQQEHDSDDLEIVQVAHVSERSAGRKKVMTAAMVSGACTLSALICVAFLMATKGHNSSEIRSLQSHTSVFQVPSCLPSGTYTTNDCCTTGYGEIKTEADCIAAAGTYSSVTTHYAFEKGLSDKSPTGCQFNPVNGAVFFQPHAPSGSLDGLVGVFCKMTACSATDGVTVSATYPCACGLKACKTGEICNVDSFGIGTCKA